MTDGDPLHREEEMVGLVRQMAQILKRIQELSGSEIDAVLDDVGQPFLLRGAQQHLRELVARQTALLDALPARVALLDFQGQAVAVNEKWRDFEQTETPGQLPDFSQGLRMVLDGEIAGLSEEYATDGPEGKRWWLLQATPTDHASGLGAVVLHIDITQRRRNKEDSERQASLLRMASQLSHLGAWAVEIPGLQLTWSQEVRDIHEVSADFHLTLESAMEFYLPRYRSEVTAAFAACVQYGAPFSLEVQVVTAKGRTAWARTLGEAVRDESGAIIRVQGAFQDITERKLHEEQFLRTQRLDSIGTLAGGLAHDLNNLLAPILLASEILTEFVTDEEGLQILETVSSSARRGAELIKRVLAFARGVEGERQNVDPKVILDEVRQVVRDTFPRSIAMDMEASPGIWPVFADPTQLHQVIMNLSVNARDAMPAGGRLTLSLENVVVDELFAGMKLGSRPGNFVMIKAEDTGCGMSTEVRDRIFEPFFTTKKVGAGTGLGLSTVFSIVRGHGGFIDVYSEPGRGTCFQVYFPAQPDAAGVADRLTPEPLPLRGDGELVLLVDDEKDVREITRRALERHGYRTLLAENGADAVSVYLQHRAEIAVVLTDLSMPVMDGPAAIVALRSINPRVRIVGSSGLHTDANVARATVVGMEHFIPKPYTAASLLKVLRQALAEPEKTGPAPSAPATEPSPVTPPGIVMGHGESVLIVDDLPEQTVLARRILQRAGYVVLTAHSADEALLTLGELDGAVDLMITDLRMPGMHGSELAKQVRALYPLVKVLYVSGGSLANESEDGISVLSKPYAPKVLLQYARAALESL